MKFRLTYLLTAALVGTACGTGDGPHAIASAFWTASKNGDMELAKSYMAEGGSASINETKPPWTRPPGCNASPRRALPGTRR